MVAREGVAPKALDQHRKIFMAIAKNNAEAARTAMENHLDSMAACLDDSAEDLRRWPLLSRVSSDRFHTGNGRRFLVLSVRLQPEPAVASTNRRRRRSSSQNSGGIAVFIIRQLSSTSAADLAPGITEHTASCMSGNCRAAA